MRVRKSAIGSVMFSLSESPGGLRHAGKGPLERELAEAEPAEPELAVDRACPAALLAALAQSQPAQPDLARKALAEALGAGQMELALTLIQKVPTNKLSNEARLLLPELLEASKDYRAAKSRYRRRRAMFAGSINQDIEVSQDRLAKKAIADCNWYGSETERLSTTLMALLHALDRGRHGAADHYGRIVP